MIERKPWDNAEIEFDESHLEYVAFDMEAGIEGRGATPQDAKDALQWNFEHPGEW